jgi:hypothetical protein
MTNEKMRIPWGRDAQGKTTYVVIPDTEELAKLQDTLHYLIGRVGILIYALKYPEKIENPTPAVKKLAGDEMSDSNWSQLMRKANNTLEPIVARFGEAMPEGVPDFRDELQRPGLILLGYSISRRRDGSEYFTAFWLSSTGNARRWYASNPTVLAGNNTSVMPDCLTCGEWAAQGASDDELIFNIQTAPELYGEKDSRASYLKELSKSGVDMKPYKYRFSLSALKRTPSRGIRLARETL